ncbi:MAG: bifunctional diaminohydroxyphosphoribosylaminopyrimidine deaminase/5-amino-6-(5-phosphoribosylamino)uracil reductase RibD [Proteobacteria bacterium]|nr:bifunctional diaminohydroxyphosphoribosylaminopyrimidine deaminase/5-amino-6-(5-phosphoribosylamino)uracil reductase RibD [Pseudomonadota bacterium]
MSPEKAMALALARARRGRGRTFPNPSVGAVVFRGDRVLGAGTTRPAGGAHAEIAALQAAERAHGKRALRGAEMAVTLEPCCHTGRTPPCTRAILNAGLRRVWVGMRDPNHPVRGRGLAALRRGGVRVELGVRAEQCREHHRGFVSLCERGRPWVTLKLAATLDGRIATRTGESRWITGSPARRAVHRLRAGVDAVAVGSETALADDPELTARVGRRIAHRPVRVLFDSRLRVPRTSKLYTQARSHPTWVVCGARAAGRRAAEAAGVRLLSAPLRDGHVDVEAGLAVLGEAGLTHLLVEGGGNLAASLLRAQLVDEIHWFVAPALLGGDARPALGSLAIEKLAQAVALEDVRMRRVGSDWHLEARVAAKARRGGTR